ncbi:hypothetical protein CAUPRSCDRAFT_11313 [Caulochytrium protostelioides]|nr:hypothetical protein CAUPRSCDRAFT_11313 [Caulochytrium protostelioides]
MFALLPFVAVMASSASAAITIVDGPALANCTAFNETCSAAVSDALPQCTQPGRTFQNTTLGLCVSNSTLDVTVLPGSPVPLSIQQDATPADACANFATNCLYGGTCSANNLLPPSFVCRKINDVSGAVGACVCPNGTQVEYPFTVIAAAAAASSSMAQMTSTTSPTRSPTSSPSSAGPSIVASKHAMMSVIGAGFVGLVGALALAL